MSLQYWDHIGNPDCCKLPYLMDLRLSENRNEEVFEELPLCEIKQKYEHLPGGAKFIADLQASRNLSGPPVLSSFGILAPLVCTLVSVMRSGWETTSSNRRRKLEDLQAVQVRSSHQCPACIEPAMTSIVCVHGCVDLQSFPRPETLR